MDRSGPIGKLVHGVTSGIGFATEVHGYRKSRKAAIKERELKQHDQQETSPSPSGSPPSYSATELHYEERNGFPGEEPAEKEHYTTADDEVERSWQLDEAQDVAMEESKPRKSKSGVANPDKVIRAFLQRQPLPSPSPTLTPDGYPYPAHRLAYPVAIPQRRPKDKTRGYIRAYAPDLQNMGINQETWFDFIETINEASLANPWINALNLASLAASPLPFLISTAISTAIMVATTIAIETQGRYRQNKALDTLNKEFFIPRGLFCLVMTWDPTSFSSRTNANVNTTVENTINTQGKMSHKLQSSNGVSNGMECMQTAELVFPGLDFLATASADEKKGFKSKLGRGKGFFDDYMDRKAQARFLAENPDSYLGQAGKPKFASKFGDPTHPVHGGLSALRGGSGAGAQQQSRGFGFGNDSGSSMGGRGFGGRGMGGLGGGGGLLGLVSLATNAVSDHRQRKQSSINNSNNDGRSNSHAPYGGSNAEHYDSRRNPHAPYGGSNAAHYDERRERQQYPSGVSNQGYYDERREQQQYPSGSTHQGYYNERREQQQQYPSDSAHQGYYDERREQQRYPSGFSNQGYYDERREQQQYPSGSTHQGYYGERREQQQRYPHGGSNQEYYDESRGQQQQYQQNQRAGIGGGAESLKNIFRSKVRYLMVVNMPSEEEMAEARRLTADWNAQSQPQQFYS
ncbi:hypothetical protein BO71DRAFT_481287 [Aspergillus ellipticus CBS 707.79]|uniref:Uncharacterized protein n=1 Tax=Aspergillus ellipticus CBS 707.79 TaxID=1448320 RepID=A0A319DID1_9EURO|nr:hypothetical protein BO71DRAFT_481287 [Aspergillus ellipticus CBS 707.79]